MDSTHTDFSVSFLFDQTPTEVFEAINKVPEWWSADFKGNSQLLDNEFEVRFDDVHYSRHKLTELVPHKKITWLVTDSNLSFLNNKSEWNGTENIFEISSQGEQTRLVFTHRGLVPEIECFPNCSGGWNHFLRLSLLPFITTGEGRPHQPKNR